MSRPASPLESETNSPEIEAAYAAVPPDMKAEILDGVFHMMNRPMTRHALTASRLGMVLGGAFQMGIGGPGGWILLDEPELHVGPRPDKLGPDIAGWRRERLPPTPDGAAITVAPDWVCEVISERTEEIDRGRKWRIYRREGVRHYWLVDPAARSLEACRLEAGQWKLVAEKRGDESVAVEPFEAVTVDLGKLWGW